MWKGTCPSILPSLAILSQYHASFLGSQKLLEWEKPLPHPQTLLADSQLCCVLEEAQGRHVPKSSWAVSRVPGVVC